MADGLLMQERAIQTHLITNYYAVPLMVERGKGLVIELTDGSTYNYRGNLYYSLAKVSPIHLAASMAEELRPHRITAVALSPGFLRSEQMLDHFGVDEEHWQDAVEKEPHYIESETPFFVGKAVVSLAADPHVSLKSGQALTSWDLSVEYGYCDEDGRKPHWGNYAKKQGLPIN